MYKQDYDETYPPAVFTDPTLGDIWWEIGVGPYIKGGNTGGILTCPSASSRAYAYSMNWSLSGKSDATAARPADTVLTADAAQSPSLASKDKTSPSYGLPQAGPYFFYTYPKLGEATWTTAPNFTTVKGDPQATIVLTLPDEDTAKGAGYFRYRHNVGVNASFADGHTKYLRQGSVHLYQMDPDFQALVQ
jgi:prepilin-type processing-associated H-X9-DG protein